MSYPYLEKILTTSVYDVARETPLENMPTLSQRLGSSVLLKREDLQRDIPIIYVGLRPGEKLHEDLFYDFENPMGTRHPKILHAGAYGVRAEWLDTHIAMLQRACIAHNEGLVKKLLQEMLGDDRMPVASPASAVTEPPAAAKLKVVSGK